MVRIMTEVEGGLDEPADLQPEQGALALADTETDSWTQADWESETARVLRKTRKLSDDDADALVWEKLTRTTLDGIAIPPIGIPSDLDDVPIAEQRAPRAGAWDIRARQSVVGIEAKTANEVATVDLEGGVTSLWLKADASTDFDAVLNGVYLDLAAVVLDAPDAPVQTARHFLDHLEATEAATGTNLGVSALAPADDLVAVARLAQTAGLLGVVVDATAVHDLGASDAQELAYSLVVGVRALRVLADAGIELADAAKLVEFRYAVTDEQFGSIAKLRAARRLWARVLELSELPTGPTHETGAQRQHAVTSRPMMSRFDPYVNMLRTTVAAFAGGVGGADSVTVLPFDSPLGRPETLGRRVARNISHLLIDEAHLGKVGDIAGGSYAVERLTDDLAVKAWEIFTDLERAAEPGEIDAAFAPLVEESVVAREQQIATRKRPLTGLSEFPNLAEVLPERAPDGEWEHVRPYGALYEALRDAPSATHVFLATLGPVASHTARATFASNLFAAGGIGVDVAGPTDGVDDLVAAYQDAGAGPVVCLAGADPTYLEWGQTAAEALRAAGARRVIIAGKATDYSDDACGVGIDALAFLQRTREKLA